jgi:hypothetical protein
MESEMRENHQVFRSVQLGSFVASVTKASKLNVLSHAEYPDQIPGRGDANSLGLPGSNCAIEGSIGGQSDTPEAV